MVVVKFNDDFDEGLIRLSPSNAKEADVRMGGFRSVAKNQRSLEKYTKNGV